MPSFSIVTIRFPDGSVEYRAVERLPSVGERVTRDGQAWIVVAVASADGSPRITLAPDDAQGGWPEPIHEAQPLLLR